MQNHLQIFNSLKQERAAEFKTRHGLAIKTGEGLGAAILKLMKPEWSTDKPTELLNSNGLFFSVWIDAECKAKAIARYNLHAMKLRAIKGEAFAAREFARSFRAQAKDELEGWPNWTYPKGPVTLFEGHFKLDESSLKAETSKLMDRCAALTPLLDQLLAL
jgi:hypothetical protein